MRTTTTSTTKLHSNNRCLGLMPLRQQQKQQNNDNTNNTIIPLATTSPDDDNDNNDELIIGRTTLLSSYIASCDHRCLYVAGNNKDNRKKKSSSSNDKKCHQCRNLTKWDCVISRKLFRFTNNGRSIQIRRNSKVIVSINNVDINITNTADENQDHENEWSLPPIRLKDGDVLKIRLRTNDGSHVLEFIVVTIELVPEDTTRESR